MGFTSLDCWIAAYRFSATQQFHRGRKSFRHEHDFASASRGRRWRNDATRTKWRNAHSCDWSIVIPAMKAAAITAARVA